MANNQYVNKVQFDSTVLIDLTSDTVTASSMLYGVVAHDASGATVTGSIADGDLLGYGSASPLIGTARIGTGYIWTEETGEVCVAGHSTADSAYAY